MTNTRRVALITFLVCGLLLSLGTVFGGAGAQAAVPTQQAVDDDSGSPTLCLGAPETPYKSATGIYIRTSARNDCGIFTVVWILRYQEQESAWRTIFERYVQPGTTGYIEWNCWGTGTYTYRAIHWDPNMAFNKMSPTVEFTC